MGIQMNAKFAGQCRNCPHGIVVGERIYYDRNIEYRKAWHVVCPTNVVVQTFVQKKPEYVPSAIRDGYYTVVLGWDGQEEHRTFRLHTPKEGGFAGKQIIAYLNGPMNTSDYQGFGVISGKELKVWRRFSSAEILISAAHVLLTGDTEQAGKAYALESGNCYVCNRLLTDSHSIMAGIGPVCATKVAA